MKKKLIGITLCLMWISVPAISITGNLNDGITRIESNNDYSRSIHQLKYKSF